MSVTLRPTTSADLPIIQRTLFLAVCWDGIPPGATVERAAGLPEIAVYHEGWGREGDAGVAASLDDRTVGCAFGRLFTEALHGHGYVDEQTPEIGIAVEPELVGRGIGGRLLHSLEEAYLAEGVSRLSLSVNIPNPALRLYERMGYIELDRDTDSVRMLKMLHGQPVS